MTLSHTDMQPLNVPLTVRNFWTRTFISCSISLKCCSIAQRFNNSQCMGLVFFSVIHDLIIIGRHIVPCILYGHTGSSCSGSVSVISFSFELIAKFVSFISLMYKIMMNPDAGFSHSWKLDIFQLVISE